MGKTIKHQQLILLERNKAELLDELAQAHRIPKQVLLREAVDDLLKKYEWVRTRSKDGKRPISTLKPKRKP